MEKEMKRKRGRKRRMEGCRQGREEREQVRVKIKKMLRTEKLRQRPKDTELLI